MQVFTTFLLSCVLLCTAASNGDAVCFEGYVMDTYCINLGTLLDKSTVKTLENPGEHSVHCLVDVGVCHESGFELLREPVAPSTLYTRAYKLDATGNKLALDLGRATGDKSQGCGTCTGSGTLAKGFRATVKGTIFDASAVPPVLSVTTVEASSVPCGTQGTKVPTSATNGSNTSGGQLYATPSFCVGLIVTVALNWLV